MIVTTYNPYPWNNGRKTIKTSVGKLSFALLKIGTKLLTKLINGDQVFEFHFFLISSYFIGGIVVHTKFEDFYNVNKLREIHYCYKSTSDLQDKFQIWNVILSEIPLL